MNIIPESPPTHPKAGRLGRHATWDQRNDEHKVEKIARLQDVNTLPSKVWSRRIGVLDQGDLGACTEYGFCGTARTSPISGRLTTKARKLVANPVSLYEQETAADDVPGQYPPDDTGSTVLAAMQLGKSLGVITGYTWATTLQEAATAIVQVGPGETGVNWHEGMDHPDDHGVVRPTGQIRGGHAFEVIGRLQDAGDWMWLFMQSWGPSWPEKPALNKRGMFAMHEADFMTLLGEQGELAFPYIG